jgi:hypothetical protein
MEVLHECKMAWNLPLAPPGTTHVVCTNHREGPPDPRAPDAHRVGCLFTPEQAVEWAGDSFGDDVQADATFKIRFIRITDAEGAWPLLQDMLCNLTRKVFDEAVHATNPL